MLPALYMNKQCKKGDPQLLGKISKCINKKKGKLKDVRFALRGGGGPTLVRKKIALARRVSRE